MRFMHVTGALDGPVSPMRAALTLLCLHSTKYLAWSPFCLNISFCLLFAFPQAIGWDVIIGRISCHENGSNTGIQLGL